MAKTLEEIAKQLKKMKFKSALVGGVDKKDVWKKIERLNDDYMQYIEQQRIGYEAVLAEKDRMIAGGITVNAAQILPGPGAMPPMDPGMMGVAPYGDTSSAPIGAPSPQGEGMYEGALMLPQGIDPNMLPPQGIDPNMMPPGFDPTMLPPQMQQPSPWGEGAPTGADEGAYAGMPPYDPAMMGMPPMLDENGNPLPMPPVDPAMMGGMAPFDPNMMPPQGFDPAMMGMPPMPMAPGADFAPPAAGFEPDWGNPAPPMSPHPVNMQQPPAGPQMPPFEG